MDSTSYQKSQLINSRQAQSSSLYPTKKSYNFSNMQRSIHISQADKRIQEIKRKYDTPNRKQRLSELSAKKSQYSNNLNKQNYGISDFRTKSFVNACPSTSNVDQALKQSKLNNIAKASIYSNTGSAKDHLLNSKVSVSYKQSMLGNKLYKNENQEEFFKRVKQMKQSLLYGGNDTLNSGVNSTKLNQNYTSASTQNIPYTRQSRSGLYENNPAIQKDRIQNIDKINEKIKGILDCLNENEKIRITSHKYGQQAQKRSKIDSLQQKVDPPLQQYSRTRQIGSIVKSSSKLPGSLTSSVLLSNIRPTNLGYNHRYEKSELLQKIEIPNQKNNYHKNQSDQKWEKLSAKLEKYQADNKSRFQKALEISKAEEINIKPENILVESKINQNKINFTFQSSQNKRLVFQPYESRNQRLSTQTSGQTKPQIRPSTYDLRGDLRSRSIIVPKLARHQRDRSVIDDKLTNSRSVSKFDDEINKLQKKMQKLQEQKRKLNISFKPFSGYSNTKSTSNLAYRVDRSITVSTLGAKHEFSQHKVSDFGNLCQEQSPVTLRNGPSVVQKSTIFPVEEQVSTFREKPALTQKDKQYSFEMGPSVDWSRSLGNDNQPIKPSDIKLNKLPARDQACFYDQDFTQATIGIEERRQRLMQDDSKSDTQTEAQLKTLVRLLCNQVKLDEEFRNAKIWFEYCDSKGKEAELAKFLPQKSVQEIKQIVKVRQSQNNPFFTLQSYHFTIQKVAELYRQAQNHWISQIFHKFDREVLLNQGFTKKQIDFEVKNCINLGDLVRFLNLESGTFYRNRDLALIFIRICKDHKQNENFTQVQFQWLLDAYCQQK